MGERTNAGAGRVTAERPRRNGLSGSVIALGVITLVLALATFVPSPFAIESPGPVVNVFGTMPQGGSADDGDDDRADGEHTEVLRVAGAETFETEGSLNVLSVSITGNPQRPVRWIALAAALFDRTETIVPLSSLYPDGVTADDRNRMNEALMRASERDATAAALQELGIPVRGTVTVAGVIAGGPSEGVLRKGDVILSAAGREIMGVAGLRAAVADASTLDASARGAVPLEIERAGETLEVTVDAAVPEGSEPGADPALGVSVNTDFDFPLDVAFDLEDIGGPSAGLVFSLGIYDLLTPGVLTGGLEVSGTGTIDDAGAVGAIGGLPQKIWGAADAGSDLMLMPLANCADLPERLPDGMSIAPVETLDEAIEVLASAAAGDAVSGLERCGR